MPSESIVRLPRSVLFIAAVTLALLAPPSVQNRHVCTQDATPLFCAAADGGGNLAEFLIALR